MGGQELTSLLARNIIEPVAANGIPPEFGLEFFSSGIDDYLNAIQDEYLQTFIKDGGSAFKMVVGVYGGGKTHFLYSVRNLAWRQGYAVAYVSLSSQESPFHKLELVYKAIAKNICPPQTTEQQMSGYERGIGALIKHWYSKTMSQNESDYKDSEFEQTAPLDLAGIESKSFAKAVSAAYQALITRSDEKFEAIEQWLTGEGYDRSTHQKFGILQRIDKTTAFSMIRSMAQWLRNIGYSGFVVLLDEAERVPSLSTKQRDTHLSNLREIIDECAHSAFGSVLILYAVPDESFLEGRTQVYEALRQRLNTIFDDMNPSGVRIELNAAISDPESFLFDVGMKLARVYSAAYSHQFEQPKLEQTVRLVSQAAHERHFGDIGYKRLFVQSLVPALRKLQKTNSAPTKKDVEELFRARA